MPEMVGGLARAARTGRSLEQCFELMAADTPNPLGKELRLCSRKIQMGIGLSAALEGLPERTGLVSLSVLVTTLTVHQQMGGDLVKVLERLSNTIRDRLTFLGRLRVATSASRATAILMLMLPPVILYVFIFLDPAYFTNLMSSSWGRLTTGLTFFLQFIGSILVILILKQSQRS